MCKVNDYTALWRDFMTLPVSAVPRLNSSFFSAAACNTLRAVFKNHIRATILWYGSRKQKHTLTPGGDDMIKTVFI